MKKIILLSFFLCTVCLLSAQNFVPVGTTWHYSHYHVFEHWERMHYEKDTLIGQNNCMKIATTRQTFFPGSPSTPLSLTHNVRIFYQHADTLWERTNSGTYNILFVFTAVPGTVWESEPRFVFQDPPCTTYSYTRVIDTGTVHINGQNLHYWDLAKADDTVHAAMVGRFVEKMGMIKGSFYFQGSLASYNPCSGVIPEGGGIEFSCFESDSIGFYNTSTWPYNLCEYYFSTEEEKQSDTRIFPNPATDHVQVEVATPGMYTVRVLDLQGRTLALHTGMENKGRIPFGRYKPGVYLLEITAPGGGRSMHKVLKTAD